MEGAQSQRILLLLVGGGEQRGQSLRMSTPRKGPQTSSRMAMWERQSLPSINKYVLSTYCVSALCRVLEPRCNRLKR